MANIATASTLALSPGCAATLANIKSVERPKHELVISKIKTPESAYRWLRKNIPYAHDDVTYKTSDYWASLKQTLEKKKGDCDDFAIGAAALVCDDGYTGFLMNVFYTAEWIDENKNVDNGHAYYVYKKNGLYGFVNNGGYEPAKYNSIDDLVKGINATKMRKDKIHNYRLYPIDCAKAQNAGGDLRSQFNEIKNQFFYSDDMLSFLKTNKTPLQVQNFLSKLGKGTTVYTENYFKNFIKVFNDRTASPLEAARMAAVMLNDGTYDIDILKIVDRGREQAAYIYKDNGLYGSISNEFTYFRPAVYNSIDQLKNSIIESGATKVDRECRIRPYLNLPPFHQK